MAISTKDLQYILAARSGNIRYLRAYRDYISNINITDEYMCSSVFYASMCGEDEAVRLLVLEFGADSNQCDRDGYSPFYMASCFSHISTMKLLTKECNADVNKCTDNGWSAIRYASETGNLDVISVLIDELGADFNIPDKSGVNPIVAAARNGYEHILRYFGTHTNIDTQLSQEVDISDEIRAFLTVCLTVCINFA